jgi:hypothetical protein
MPLKMDDINIFSFSFSSKLTLVANINCICNSKPLCNHLCDHKSFLLNAIKDKKRFNVSPKMKTMKKRVEV